MSHRYSRQEKGKWRDERLPPRKPLVRIPEADVSELVERNNLTLIGRVTNPNIQKTRALVDFFLQHWNVVGKITGRDLGPNLFQFSFETEKDLQVILSKAPFHFKRWMLILQKWEPVVSDVFPDRITFWIRIHGIPLHYWNDTTINAIGLALGPIVARDVDRARLRVQVDGLKPLITKMDIELPSKKIVEITLEYEHLEKHCFLCKSLSHEDGDCDTYPPTRRSGDRRQMDIAQQNTLESIEEGRKRQADRKFQRNNQATHHTGARWTNFRSQDARANHSEPREASSRHDPDRSSGCEENRRRYDDRTKPISVDNSFRRRSPPSRPQHGSGSAAHNSYRRVSPRPEPARSRNSPSKEASSNSKRTPPRDSAIAERRTSLASRLTDPRSDGGLSEERRSAKERLSVQTKRTGNVDMRETNSDSRNLQDVELQYLELPEPPVPNSTIITRPSSSNVFDAGRLGPCDRSPIRTLSEDRIHVSLRLGTLISDSDSGDWELENQTDVPLLSKAEGKKKLEKAQGRKRSSRSLVQSVAGKKRRVTKPPTPPRRKLLMDAITAGGRGLSGVSRGTPKPPKIVPPTVKQRKDFHPPQSSLP